MKSTATFLEIMLEGRWSCKLMLEGRTEVNLTEFANNKDI